MPTAEPKCLPMHRILLESLSEQELNSLTIEGLAQRMDDVLQTLQRERDGPNNPLADFPEDARRILQPSAVAFLATPTVSALDDIRRRRVLQRFFAYLVQLELTSVGMGIENITIWHDKTPNAHSERSPLFRFRLAALNQYLTISSRMVMENLFALLYDLGTGNPFPGGRRSRIKFFQDWLMQKPEENLYVCFARATLATRRFDRGFRSPEIHAGSRYPRRFLLMNKPCLDEYDGALKFINETNHVMGLLFDILDGKAPSLATLGASEEWQAAYGAADGTTLRRLLGELFSDGGE